MKKLFYLFITCILLAMVLSSVFVQAKEDEEIVPESNRIKCFTSIQIEKGDTLISIAKRYISDEYKDYDEYIKEVKEINDYKTDTIYAGYYIIVPYYKTVE